MPRETWPALIAALSWAFLLVSLGAAWRPGGPADWLAPLLLAGIPLAISSLAVVRARMAAGRGPTTGEVPQLSPETWRMRMAIAVALGLLLDGFGVVLSSDAAHATFAVGSDASVAVRRLVPGPSEAWAYLAALILTVGALSGTRRARLAATGALGIAALVGGTALAWNASVAVPATGTAAVGCREPPDVPVNVMRSRATGELDGDGLGHVDARRSTDQPAILIVEYEGRWGTGRALLPGSARPGSDPLEAAALSPEALLTADDLGVDSVDGRAARHCQVVIDGRSAVQGFPALRWLVGEDERTADPGAGLGAWRGTLDYWLVSVSAQRITTGEVVVATVSVDGQPPGWPFPGLRATLRAASSFGLP